MAMAMMTMVGWLRWRCCDDGGGDYDTVGYYEFDDGDSGDGDHNDENDDDWDEVEDGKENGEGECRWWLCCLRR